MYGCRLVRFTAAATLVALTSIAGAAPPGLTPVAPAPEPQSPAIDYTDCYRGQTLGADGIAVGLVVLAAVNAGTNGRSTNTVSMLELALATYAIGGPLVHLLHDRPGHAAGSLALRVGAPVVLALAGGFLGSLQSSCDYCSSDSSGGAALGAVLGVITASVLDATILARGDDRPSATHVTVAPIHGGGVSFGVARAF